MQTHTATAAETEIAQTIIGLERAALDRWGQGDPSAFLELYGDAISYFDPVTATRIDGLAALTDYYRPWAGTIRIARFDMLSPEVVVGSDMALLSYNLVNYREDAAGIESVDSQWNSTAVFQRQGEEWKSIHSHWSFTQHPAFHNMAPPATEG